MYCSSCGTPLASGLSYCNRCGASLKERSSIGKAGTISAFLIAITAIAITGLGIMLGGAIALRREAGLNADLVGVFMLMTFLLVLIVEIFLCRQLARVNTAETMPRVKTQPHEIAQPHPRTLPEPLPSVTENTTRTFEYPGREPVRR
jgi:hypothetical protein